MYNTIVAENERLVYHIYYRRIIKTPIIMQHEEELLQEGRIGLFIAAKTHDKDKHAFSTYAYACIYNRMLQYIRQLKINPDIILIPLNGLEDTQQDTIEHKILQQNPEDLYLEHISIKTFMASTVLSDKQKHILLLRSKGLTEQEIGNILNTTQSVISRNLKRIKQKYITYTEVLNETV